MLPAEVWRMIWHQLTKMRFYLIEWIDKISRRQLPGQVRLRYAVVNQKYIWEHPNFLKPSGAGPGFNEGYYSQNAALM
jgi:hypothetical protein